MPLDEVPLHPKTSEPIYQSDNGLIGYKKSIQFNYNANNEPSTIIVIEDTGLEVTKTTTSYFYDAFGRRIAKTSKIEQLNKLNQRGELVKHPTALLHLRKTDKTTYQSTLMLWEGNRQIQEYTDDFVFTTVYDDESFIPVARIVQVRNSSNKQPHSSNDEHLKNVENTETFKVYHYHNNHLGTPQELTDDCGEVIWANYEWAWGGRYTHFYKEQSLNGCAIIESDLQPIRFQGQFFDTETSLHYNRFRYYDSDVGMFIQRDPIGLLGGSNVFAYAPNPVGWVDPLGLNKTPAKDCCKKDECGKVTKNANLPNNGLQIHSNTTKKGQKKIEYLFANMNDAKNRGANLLGLSKTKIYDSNGKWIGWRNNKNDTIYWKHNDWGKGVGSSTFPHINYEINGVSGHFYLRDKIINRKEWCNFAKYYNLK